jgi:membrane-associated phospholipid phosphatase
MTLRRYTIAIILLAAGVCSNGAAQPDTTRPSALRIIGSDVAMAFDDAGTLFSAPLHFSRSDWMITGAVLGGTAALFSLDKSVRTLARENQSTSGDHISSAVKEYGNPVYGVALAGGLYVGGLVFDSKEARLTGTLIVESMTFSAVITNVIKSAAGRSRPFMEEGNTRFRGFQFKDGTTSMPSGHATVAFAVSSVLSERIHDTYASIGLYALSTLTAASRVYDDEHWVSDTFLGAAIGTAVGISVCHLHERGDAGTSIRISPTVGGVLVEFDF